VTERRSEEHPGEVPDAELLARTATGDRRAFGQLVVRHQAAVARFARAASPSLSDAEDVLQEAFLAALRGAGSFRGASTVRTWLLGITRHAALHRRRRDQRYEPLQEESLDVLGRDAGWGADPLTTPEQAMIGAEQRADVIRALDSLPPDQREILVLRDGEGLSGDETASILGVSLDAMKSRLHRARLKFAASLRRGDPHGT
jgi:RNA polymerase sigma-70 factor (ECF subfamily)